jgi:hypothetical protein
MTPQRSGWSDPLCAALCQVLVSDRVFHDTYVYCRPLLQTALKHRAHSLWPTAAAAQPSAAAALVPHFTQQLELWCARLRRSPQYSRILRELDEDSAMDLLCYIANSARTHLGMTTADLRLPWSAGLALAMLILVQQYYVGCYGGGAS